MKLKILAYKSVIPRFASQFSLWFFWSVVDKWLVCCSFFPRSHFLRGLCLLVARKLYKLAVTKEKRLQMCLYVKSEPTGRLALV